jgi:hypothetical protein
MGTVGSMSHIKALWNNSPVALFPPVALFQIQSGGIRAGGEV